jgi:hypothetical protein
MTKAGTTSWFDIDKEGLAKVLRRRKTRSFLVFEPVQNAWDEASEEVDIKMFYDTMLSVMNLNVADDNPEGFKNLTHAYTLFAESDKKGDPTKRGRFNIGDKIAFACCIDASVMTTKGTIHFNADGRRRYEDEGTDKGSAIDMTVKMSQTEFMAIKKEVGKLISPVGVTTRLNGKEIPRRVPVATFRASLPTEIADIDGNLRATERICQVDVYEPLSKVGQDKLGGGQLNKITPSIYEMGIPVVEIDDRFDINVQQKVPLNIDRTNVTPSYLRRLRTKVLNETVGLLSEEDATQPWVQEASSQKDCTVEAITEVASLKYGDKRVSYDLHDPEANKRAMSEGYTVVTGGAFTKGQWENIRKAEAIPPAGQVTPSPKPYSPDGKPLNVIPVEKWTKKMTDVADFAKAIAWKTMKVMIKVTIADESQWQYNATFSTLGELVLNKQALGNDFFEDFPGNMAEVCRMLIHEFGHYYSGDHLSSEYHNALCKLGAKMAVLALEEPGVFG